MSSEIMLSGSGFQVLLLFILVICISVYFFFEVRKINLRITSQEMRLNTALEEIKNSLSKNETKNSLSEKEVDVDPSEQNAGELMNLENIPHHKIVEDHAPHIPWERQEPKGELSSGDPLFNGGKIQDMSLDITEDSKKDADISEKSYSEVSDNSDNSESDASESGASENSDASDASKRSEDSMDIEDAIKELQEMSVKELKSILQERDLPVSGNKTTMIERIVDSLKK
tara:strand:+ start:550 stop:1236 length:687 start_codon:yes stop_codon:yes gene_type:complete